MSQVPVKGRIMLLLLAATASQVGVNQIVIGHVHFIPAAAAAVPDDGAAFGPLFSRRYGGQAAESLAGNVDGMVVFL